jgi:hypothetical protein
MKNIPITGLEALESHLQKLQEDPETPLDAPLFDEVQLQLTGGYACLASSLVLCSLGTKQGDPYDKKTLNQEDELGQILMWIG